MLAAPAEQPDPSVALLPMQVDGSLDDPTRTEFGERLAEGLRRAEVTVSPADVAYDADTCDAACRASLREVAGVDHLVLVSLVTEERAYRIRIDLFAADGTMLHTIKEQCDPCGRSEVGSLLESKGAILRQQIDLLPPLPPVRPRKNTGPTPRPREDAVSRARSPMWGWGWATFGVGLGVSVAGATLLGLHNRPFRGRCEEDDIDFAGRCRFLYDTAAGGATALAVGVALIATGIALVVRGRRPQRSKAAMRWGFPRPTPIGVRR